MSTDCHTIDLTGTTQEAVAKELTDIAKKLYGVEMNFNVSVKRIKKQNLMRQNNFLMLYFLRIRSNSVNYMFVVVNEFHIE